MALAVIAAAAPSCGSTATSSASAPWIAFHADPGGSDDPFLVTSDGSRRRRLTHGLEQVATSFWAPDGKRLAFLAPVGSPGVYVVRPDGHGLRRLTSGGGFFDLAWSPDFDAAGGVALRNLLARESSQPAWSPGGTRLAYAVRRNFGPAGNFRVGVMRSDGTGKRLLPPVLYGGRAANSCCPAWQPRGAS